MSRARALVFATSALGIFAAACGPKKAEESATQVPAVPVASAPASTPASLPPPPTVRVRVQVEALDDAFKAADALMANWNDTPPATDTKTTWANALRGGGFKDSFITNIDLVSRHDFDLRVPTTGSSSDPAYRNALSILAALAGTDVSGLATGMPPSTNVTAIDGQTWSGKLDDIALVLRRSAKHLLIGRTPADAEHAAALPSTPALDPGRRYVVQLSEMPAGLLSDAADNAPEEIKPQVKKVLAELQWLSVGADVGVGRDASLVFGGKGPFDQLGLALLGTPANGPSKLATALPGDALAVLQVPWGNPKQALEVVHKFASQAPEPMAPLAQSATANLDALFAQIHDEVVAAFYLDANGRLGVVFAAAVKDPAAADQAIDGLWVAVQKVAEVLLAAQGDAKEFKFTAKYSAKGKVAGKASRDFSLTLSPDQAKGIQEDDDMAWVRLMLDGSANKPVLNAHTLVDGNVALLALGSGGKGALQAFVAGQKKPLATHLESDGALARARGLTHGCQVCATIDATHLLRLYAHTTGLAAKQAKKGAALAKRFANSKLQGDLVFSMLATGSDGRIGMSAAKETLFADPAVAKAVRQTLKDTEALEAGANATPSKPDKSNAAADEPNEAKPKSSKKDKATVKADAAPPEPAPAQPAPAKK